MKLENGNSTNMFLLTLSIDAYLNEINFLQFYLMSKWT